MMDLSEFVSQTLTQIASGVHQARKPVADLGGKLIPQPYLSMDAASKLGLVPIDGGAQIATIVHFDVALTVTQGTGTKGGIGVFAGAINLGSSGQSTAENTSVSRVAFTVPMSLPSK